MKVSVFVIFIVSNFISFYETKHFLVETVSKEIERYINTQHFPIL